MKEHIIWQNTDLNIEDWREGYIEHCEMNNINPADKTDDDIYDWMIEENDNNYHDETMNLDMDINNDIIAIASLGLWNGRRSGYKMLGSNIKDCLNVSASCDLQKYFVDSSGEFRFTGHHHDGTNHIRFRVWKKGITEEQQAKLTDAIYYDKEYEYLIQKYTQRIGDYIGDIYGWKFTGRPKKAA